MGMRNFSLPPVIPVVVVGPHIIEDDVVRQCIQCGSIVIH